MSRPRSPRHALTELTLRTKRGVDRRKFHILITLLLEVHQHEWTDKYGKKTTSYGPAAITGRRDYSGTRCSTCGNQPTGVLYCPTISALVIALELPNVPLTAADRDAMGGGPA